MEVSYLLVVFDVNKGELPSQVAFKYIPKKTWQTLQRDDLLTVIEIDDSNIQYEIINRRSFRMPDSMVPKMVLVIDVKKVEQ